MYQQCQQQMFPGRTETSRLLLTVYLLYLVIK